MNKNRWYTASGLSLALFSRYAGFDLATYYSYSPQVQDELRKRSINEALFEIRNICSQQGCNIDFVTNGIYVISLANPLSIQYRNRRSQVIYVGRGNIMVRIKDHFEKSLFDLMLDLSGAEFNFSFACPALKGTADYYKHVEHLMLKYFYEQYGGLSDKKRYPLLNKYAGNNKNFIGGTDWWKKPLKASGKRPLWELNPTNFSHYAPLD